MPTQYLSLYYPCHPPARTHSIWWFLVLKIFNFSKENLKIPFPPWYTYYYCVVKCESLLKNCKEQIFCKSWICNIWCYDLFSLYVNKQMSTNSQFFVNMYTTRLEIAFEILKKIRDYYTILKKRYFVFVLEEC